MTTACFCTHWSIFCTDMRKASSSLWLHLEKALPFPWLRRWGPWHGCARVGNTHSLWMPLTQDCSCSGPHWLPTTSKSINWPFYFYFWELFVKFIGQFIDWQFCLFLCFMYTYIQTSYLYICFLYIKCFIIYNNFTCSLMLFITYIIYIIYICCYLYAFKQRISVGRDQEIRKRP